MAPDVVDSFGLGEIINYYQKFEYSVVFKKWRGEMFITQLTSKFVITIVVLLSLCFLPLFILSAQPVYDGVTFTDILDLMGHDKDGAIVRNCTFANLPGRAMRITDVSNGIIENCVFDNMPETCIYFVNGSTGWTVRNCTFKNISRNGILTTEGPNGLTIEHNIFEDVATDTTGEKLHAMYIQSHGFLIQNNRIDNVHYANGISIRSTGTVKNNTVSRAGTAGVTSAACIKYFPDHPQGPEPLLIENNICWDPANHVIYIDDQAGGSSNQADSVFVRFNTVLKRPVSYENGYEDPVCIQVDPGMASEYVEVYGNLIVNSANLSDPSVNPPNTDLSVDNKLYTSNPGFFEDWTNSDFHITNDPAVIDSALNVPAIPADDVDKDTRPNGSYADIGADEYDSGYTDTYILTVNTSGSGSVTINPTSSTYNFGTVVTLTADPDPNWVFEGWTGDLNGLANPITITMNFDKTVTATFNYSPGPSEAVADSDIVVFGTVTGSYTDTHTSNDVSESIEEIESGGKPTSRYTYLEHKWAINVTGGNSLTFYVEAYHTSNSEGDDFIFSYSTNGISFTDMLTVIKTSDDDTYQSYVLPEYLSGLIYIRVKDLDQTPGNRTLDKIFIDHMYIYVEMGAVSPPSAPSNLVATAVSSSQIDLEWVDNADNEAGFKIEQSTDGGQNFVEIDQVGANITDYSDTELSPSTQYCYQVRAYNGGGNSGYSNTDCATTQEGGSGPFDDVANSDIPVAGTVTGSYTDTQTSNDGYESIEEIESGGKPANRYTYLEHKWTINVTGGSSVTFYIEAYKTANSEGDDFVFAYSTNDADYTNMVTVTKTSDDDTYQSYVLPGSLSGTVYIRVKDTDQTAGNRTKDTIYIDHMYIQSASSKEIAYDDPVKIVIPTEIKLYRNYPNPFNPSTTIRYDLTESGHVTLTVYDMMGRMVSTLVDCEQGAGVYTQVWEAVDTRGQQLSSGVYLYRFQIDSHIETMKMILMR
jgi:hypothetical protein